MLISLVPVTLLFLVILLFPDHLAQHSMLRHLLIYRPHRKQLITLVLSPSTMQWTPFKIYRGTTPIPTPIQLGELGSLYTRWVHTLLGPEFSSDTMGDSSRSTAAANRRAKFIAKVQTRRASQALSRTNPTAAINPVLTREAVTLRGTKTRPRRLNPVVPITPSVQAFYEDHKGDNKWVSIREGGTITGTVIDKGVFAKTDIPPNTRITLVKDSEDQKI
jgi:hypothetical protein